MELYKLITGHYYILDDEYLKIIPYFVAYDLMKKNNIYIEFEKKKDKDKLTSKIKLEDIIIKNQNIIVKKESKKNIEKVTITEIIQYDNNNDHIKYDRTFVGNETNEINEKNCLYFQYEYNTKEFKQIDIILFNIISLINEIKHDVDDFLIILYSFYFFTKDDEEYKNNNLLYKYLERLTEMKSSNIIKMTITNQKVQCCRATIPEKYENINYVMYNHIQDTWSIIDKQTFDKLRYFGQNLTVSEINQVL
jgi:hypothetical protein